MDFPAGQTLRGDSFKSDETFACDVVIIGAGAGGAAAAWQLTQGGLSVAILELRIKLNQIDDSELKALCDAMLREAETAEHSRLQKSHEAPRGRSSVTLKLVK